MHTQDIMSRPPITCGPEDRLDQAARLMWEHDCGTVMVTEPRGQLVGIITDRDICIAAYTQGKAPSEIRVAEAMANQVHSCRCTDLVEQALVLMARAQVRRLPVVTADNRPIGLLSLNNLIRYCAASDDHLRRQLVQTMAIICQPRSVEAWANGAGGAVQHWHLREVPEKENDQAGGVPGAISVRCS